jgi:uncharacterized protein YecT (DUF1311 family)
MSEFVCEFCNISFTSKSNLVAHKKYAKKCLKLQNKEIPKDFSCEKCGKVFTSKQVLLVHTEKCEGTDILQAHKDLSFKYQTIVSSFDEKIADMTAKLHVKDGLIQAKDADIEKKDKQIADLQRQLAELTLKKNTITVRNTKASNRLVPYDLNAEIITRVINEKFTESVLRGKSKGVAKFAMTHLLQGENGTMKMVCTDMSRKKFACMDSEENVYIDVRASRLLDVLVPAIEEKSLEIIKQKTGEDMCILTNCMFDITQDNVASRLAEFMCTAP